MSSITSITSTVRSKSLRKAHSMPHIPLPSSRGVDADRQRFNGDYEYRHLDEQMTGCSAAGKQLTKDD